LITAQIAGVYGLTVVSWTKSSSEQATMLRPLLATQLSALCVAHDSDEYERTREMKYPKKKKMTGVLGDIFDF
jgi:Zn-finger nucleic acid-binding protein